jgi:ribonuclease HII
MAEQARRKKKKRVMPAVWRLRRHEEPYREKGIVLLGGVDEVGVGPLAGPVVAAAVIMPADSAIRGVDDSKRVLKRELRRELAQRIRGEALAVGVGVARPREIDRVNVYRATLAAMARAVRRLDPAPELLLVDARTVPGVAVPQEAHVKGDACFYQIACASLVAKDFRDRLMVRLDERYPGYGFARHVGYRTPQHLEALRRLGPCWIHRRRYSDVIGELQGDLADLWGEEAPEEPLDRAGL